MSTNNKPKHIIGLCHGCFDLLHCGHILHLREAKNSCDFLIVSLTVDQYVGKGHGRPIYKYDERCLILSSISYVDKVIPSSATTATKNLKLIKPDIYFKGIDYADSTDPRLGEELDFCKSINCRIAFTKTRKYSTTEVIRHCGSLRS
jgi:rfaE bifunctional protein nucleotidyltransferase chain/domain